MRERKGIVVTAAGGTGKSRYALSRVLKLCGFKNGQQREPVLWLCALFPSNDFQGLPVITRVEDIEKAGSINKIQLLHFPGLDSAESLELKAAIYSELKKIRNFTSVFDDADIYEKYKLSKDFEELISPKRQRGMDFVAIYKSLSRTPPGIYTHCSEIVMGKTTDSPTDAQRKTPVFERVMEAVEELEKVDVNDRKFISISTMS